MRQILASVIAAIYGLLTHSVLATVYYVSGSGNDGNSGLATNAAWLTIACVNSQKLLPGDRVLFESGTTFSGSIHVVPPEAGSNCRNRNCAGNPIISADIGQAIGHR